MPVNHNEEQTNVIFVTVTHSCAHEERHKLSPRLNSAARGKAILGIKRTLCRKCSQKQQMALTNAKKPIYPKPG